MSIHAHTPVQLPLDGFSQNLILGNYWKICPDNPDVVKIRQKYQAFYVKT
jgi:hypothetical protein